MSALGLGARASAGRSESAPGRSHGSAGWCSRRGPCSWPWSCCCTLKSRTGDGTLGSLAETFLPWLRLIIPVLLAGALRRRSASALAALLLPAVVWLNLFGEELSDKSRPGGFLTVASENVNAGNPDPAGTARDLAASGADVLALVELTPQAAGTYEKGLAKAYPYHTLQGTVGLWSKLPLSDTQPIDIMDYRALAYTMPAD